MELKLFFFSFSSSFSKYFFSEYKIKRTAYTQPNTPDLGHTERFRQVVTPEVFLDDRPQKHVSFQQKSMRFVILCYFRVILLLTKGTLIKNVCKIYNKSYHVDKL